MKKIIFLALAMAFSVVVEAQNTRIYLQNGGIVSYPADSVDYVEFLTLEDSPYDGLKGSVDLGLSVRWATCNLGANSPEETGDYYAWGETETKSYFDTSNYDRYLRNGDFNNLTNDNDISGWSWWDAATKKLGDPWRIPKPDELSELVSKCTWQQDTLNGVAGAKVIGPNGNSIFLPKCGFKGVNAPYDRVLGYGSYGQYWSSKLDNQWSHGYAIRLFFSSSAIYVQGDFPSWAGMPIRPVYTHEEE